MSSQLVAIARTTRTAASSPLSHSGAPIAPSVACRAADSISPDVLVTA